MEFTGSFYLLENRIHSRHKPVLHQVSFYECDIKHSFFNKDSEITAGVTQIYMRVFE